MNATPELRLLLGLLRSVLGTGAGNQKPARINQVDWAAFLDTVRRHRAGGLLYHGAKASLDTHCPEFVLHEIKLLAEETTRRALSQAAEQIRLGRMLENVGVESMPVKGLVLAQQLYGTVGIRHVGDLDLLIRPEDAERAHIVLTKAGLQRTRPAWPLTPRQTKAYPRLQPDYEYSREQSPRRIELLWRLEGVPPTASIWDTTVMRTVGGHPQRTLNPELNALYVLQHGARHGWFRLFWLVDAALLFRDSNIDWATTIRRARDLNLERPLLQAARLVRDLLGVDPPSALHPRPHEQRLTTHLAAEARRQIARRPTANEPVAEWARQTCYRVRLQKGLQAKFDMLLPHLNSPLNWQTLPLPDRWFFLYPALTPVLWIWRCGQRAGRKHLETES